MRLHAAGSDVPPVPRPLPYTFAIDGEAFTVPAIGDAALFELIAGERWDCLVPGALSQEDQYRLAVLLEDPCSAVDWPHVWRASTDAVEAVCGMPWHAAVRLAAATQHQWLTFQAWAITNQFNPACEPVPRVLAAAYAWIIGNAGDQKKAERLHAEIFNPPPNLAPVYAEHPTRWMEWEEQQYLVDM